MTLPFALAAEEIRLYRASEKKYRPALVVGVNDHDNGTVNLIVFYDGDNDRDILPVIDSGHFAFWTTNVEQGPGIGQWS